jgi:hypothetical protein
MQAKSNKKQKRLARIQREKSEKVWKLIHNEQKSKCFLRHSASFCVILRRNNIAVGHVAKNPDVFKIKFFTAVITTALL